MPNNCINSLMISGNSKEIHKLLKNIQVKEKDFSDFAGGVNPFSFQQVIPRPKSKQTGEEQLNWNIQNWGTKWDCYDLEECGDWEKGNMGFTFSTAWSPPIPVIDKLATRYKKLNFVFTFHEAGNNFCGVYNYNEGLKEVEYDGTITEANCEVLDIVMGTSHHWCDNCGDSIHCEGEPVSLCEKCSEEEQEVVEQEEQLWDTETEKVNAGERHDRNTTKTLQT